MKKTLLITIAIAPTAIVLAIIASGTRGERSTAWSATMKDSGMGVSMTTNKVVYKQGEPIAITLKVFNGTDDEISFQFRSGQRYDFVIKDAKGDEIWRWSRGRMFTMALGQITLGPKNKQLVYTEVYKGELGAGTYKITGMLADHQRTTSASLTITVK